MMKTILLSIVLAFCSLMVGCALFQEKGGGENDSAADNQSENRKMLMGTWKMTAEHCDKNGSNCEQYSGNRTLRFDKNGAFFINDTKRASYRVAGNSFILDSGQQQYTVNIILIDASILITGEGHRTTTEIFMHLK